MSRKEELWKPTKGEERDAEDAYDDAQETLEMEEELTLEQAKRLLSACALYRAKSLNQ